jgi:hypothetical protein
VTVTEEQLPDELRGRLEVVLYAADLALIAAQAVTMR